MSRSREPAAGESRLRVFPEVRRSGAGEQKAQASRASRDAASEQKDLMESKVASSDATRVVPRYIIPSPDISAGDVFCFRYDQERRKNTWKKPLVWSTVSTK